MNERAGIKAGVKQKARKTERSFFKIYILAVPFFDEEGLDFISSCRTQMELCNAHPNQRLSGDQQMEMLVDLCGGRPR